MTKACLVFLVLTITFPILTQGGGSAKTYPTNLELVQRAANSASLKVAEQLTAISLRVIILRAESSRPADWVVESALTSALMRSGFKIYQAPPGADSAATLSYRVVDLGITYQEKPGGVERVARVRIAFNVTQVSAGRVLSSGDGQGTVQDLVPAAVLPTLESPEMTTVRLPARESMGNRLLEPALLSAVVAGLIYLFYASKAAK